MQGEASQRGGTVAKSPEDSMPVGDPVPVSRGRMQRKRVEVVEVEMVEVVDVEEEGTNDQSWGLGGN